MSVHKIVFEGGAQDLPFVCHVTNGGRREPRVPDSAPTYTIEDWTKGDEGSERTVQASGAATLSSVSTTTTAACGAGTADPALIPLMSAANVSKGTRLLVEKAGRYAAVTVDRVDGLNVYATHPIAPSITTGAAVTGLDVTGTFPAAEAADETQLESGGGPYLILWSYVVGSVTYTSREVAFVNRAGRSNHCTVEDVRRVDQRLLVQTRDEAWSVYESIEMAHQYIEIKLAEKQIPPESIHAPALSLCHTWWVCADGRRQIGEHRMADHWWGLFESTFLSLLTGAAPLQTAIGNVNDEAQEGTSDRYGAGPIEAL